MENSIEKNKNVKHEMNQLKFIGFKKTLKKRRIHKQKRSERVKGREREQIERKQWIESTNKF